MEKVNLEMAREKVSGYREELLALIPEADRDNGSVLLDKFGNIIAMTATDIAIEAASSAFISKIKDAAEAGKAQAESDMKETK